ncbi:PLP-dependent aminotransferase family protein [Herbidospora sp. NBRC 101105]|uniref:MocR-like pyridoxine biosynthesis transcription factor PdxR n=1 Tax=Herbidospora sp. NBRC 101105 TaxID=3032195 RepID=UPI0025521FC8|nr:PLP-dependent aminotransferase family protein [Herbidospora sp. NBRC 101105]
MRETTLREQQVELPVAVDRSSPTPLVVQVGDQLRAAMRDGALRAGERLPSSRGLAGLLGVSRTVVTEAYQQLYAEGWLDGRHGSGTYVADVHAVEAASPAEPGTSADADFYPPLHAPDAGLVDLRPGRPWVMAYDTAAWRRAWRAAGDLPMSAWPDLYGDPMLREALADHLRRARAVPAGPGNVLITRGTGNGLDLLAATLLKPGDRVGVEEPGYRSARRIFASRGAEIVPCPVDADGLVVDDLPAGLRMIYTTPAHQFPTGGRLPIPRRERLLAWARATGALVVEDDYDAEFRYDVAPLPALYGLGPEQVVLLGTLSKSLSPDVGVGWLVAGRPLLDQIARTRKELADRTSGPVQRAVAVLLDRGDLDRHLRRMRLEYARRREAVVAALGPWTKGDTAGLHVLAELPEHVVPEVVAGARERGVLVDTTVRHHHGPPRVHGLVVGYGSAALHDVRHGCGIVRSLLDHALQEPQLLTGTGHL